MRTKLSALFEIRTKKKRLTTYVSENAPCITRLLLHKLPSHIAQIKDFSNLFSSWFTQALLFSIIAKQNHTGFSGAERRNSELKILLLLLRFDDLAMSADYEKQIWKKKSKSSTKKTVTLTGKWPEIQLMNHLSVLSFSILIFPPSSFHDICNGPL